MDGPANLEYKYTKGDSGSRETTPSADVACSSIGQVLAERIGVDLADEDFEDR